MMKPSGRLRLVGLAAVVWLLLACASTPANTAEPTALSDTPTVTPTLAPVSTTVPKPPPAVLIVQGQEQSSGIGSYCWAEPASGDTAVALCADMIGILTFETTISAGDSERVVQSATWQIDERLGDYGLGGEWVSPDQFLVYETLAEGPLILDAERGVVPVLTELFGLREIPSILGEEGYSLRATAASGVEANAFHLLLTSVGLESNFPPVMLYHAESGVTETLPYRYAWWTPFSGDGVWLLMDQRPDVDGHENHAIWMRRVEETGGQWQLLATGVDAVRWSDDGTQMAFSSKETVTWQTFPIVELIGRWDSGEFWTRPVGWSADGRFLATEGSVPGTWQYGLFLLKRPTDAPPAP